MSDSSIDAGLLNYLSWWGVPTFFGASMIRSYPIWKLVLWGSPSAVVTVPPNVQQEDINVA